MTTSDLGGWLHLCAPGSLLGPGPHTRGGPRGPGGSAPRIRRSRRLGGSTCASFYPGNNPRSLHRCHPPGGKSRRRARRGDRARPTRPAGPRAVDKERPAGVGIPQRRRDAATSGHRGVTRTAALRRRCPRRSVGGTGRRPPAEDARPVWLQRPRRPQADTRLQQRAPRAARSTHTAPCGLPVPSHRLR